MHPFFNIFGRTVPAYGFFAAIAILSGLLYVYLRSPRKKAGNEKAVTGELHAVTRDDAAYIYVFGVFGVGIGAKLLYIFTILPEFINDLPLLFSDTSLFLAKYVSGGMVFYGGLIGGLVFAYFSAKSYKVSFSSCIPVMIPAIALAHGIARIGCFFAGCCHGIATDSLVGIAYSNTPFAPNGVPLVPVQLFEAAAEFLIFIFLVFFTNKASRSKFTLEAYVLLYAPVRFTLEFFRGDAERGVFFGMSTSQWISIICIFGAVISVIIRDRKMKQLTKKRQ